MARRLRRWSALSSVVVVLAACGGESRATTCAPAERAVETSNVHALPGTDVSYEHSPPASGPHQLPAPADGIYDEPLPEPRQVAALEAGSVVIQYQPGNDPATVAALEALGSQEGVLVAPGGRGFDDEAAIAFTAWGRRQLCHDLDVDAAQAFVDAYQGAVFVSHDGD